MKPWSRPFSAAPGRLGQEGDSVLLPAVIDACADGRHGCQHQCVSVRGSYTCHCRAGYYLHQNKKSCISMWPSPFLSLLHLLLALRLLLLSFPFRPPLSFSHQ